MTSSFRIFFAHSPILIPWLHKISPWTITGTGRYPCIRIEIFQRHNRGRRESIVMVWPDRSGKWLSGLLSFASSKSIATPLPHNTNVYVNSEGNCCNQRKVLVLKKKIVFLAFKKPLVMKCKRMTHCPWVDYGNDNFNPITSGVRISWSAGTTVSDGWKLKVNLFQYTNDKMHLNRFVGVCFEDLQHRCLR